MKRNGATNTFNEALELAYAECWRMDVQYNRFESGELKVVGGEAGRQSNLDGLWREGQGAQSVLGALLAARGDVGRQTFPALPGEELPDVQQVWIRLMQWGIRHGFTTQDKLDEVLDSSPPYAEAMRLLGQDCEKAATK